MQKSSLQNARENLQHRILVTIVLAIGFLIWRQFTTSKIIVIAFLACTIYGILVFSLWIWVTWQINHLN